MARNRYGWTPLIAASVKGHVAIVKALLHHGGIEIDATWGSWDYTALHQATQYGHEKVVEILLHAGADPTLVDQKGRTVVDMACCIDPHPNRMIRMLKVCIHTYILLPCPLFFLYVCVLTSLIVLPLFISSSHRNGSLNLIVFII